MKRHLTVPILCGLLQKYGVLGLLLLAITFTNEVRVWSSLLIGSVSVSRTLSMLLFVTDFIYNFYETFYVQPKAGWVWFGGLYLCFLQMMLTTKFF